VTARLEKERVGAVLQRCTTSVVEAWLARAKQSNDLNGLLLSDEQRSGHLPRLVEDVARRLRQSSGTVDDSDAIFSPGAVVHGKLRYLQGYTLEMLVHEARILEVTIFGTLQNNRSRMDFNLLLPDVMAIADEVDSQLTQSIDSYMKLMKSMQPSGKKPSPAEPEWQRKFDRLQKPGERVHFAKAKRPKRTWRPDARRTA
jgi:hypothetical protein